MEEAARRPQAEEFTGICREFPRRAKRGRIGKKATLLNSPSEYDEKPLTIHFAVCILTTVSQGA
jgi:hypothetical protein